MIPLAKYNKAMYNQVSLGMRFRMMFETDESGVRRYMGTVTGVSDLDPVRWKGSQWRNLQVLLIYILKLKLHEFSILKTPKECCIAVGLVNSLNICSQLLLANHSTFILLAGWVG